MSWLSALGGAASSLLAKGGGMPGLPNFGLGNRDTSFDQDASAIWALHEGIKRDDNSAVSIFVFEASAPGWGGRGSGGDRRSLLPLAKNALRKLRTLRHPDVLKFLDGSETDSAVFIVTEQVVGLPCKLSDLQAKGKATGPAGDEWKVWGISRIVSALKFINGPGASTHGNIRTSSVFTTPSGEWRLGGFELLSSPRDQQPVLYTFGGILPGASLYASPECSNGYDVLRDQDPACLDAYQLHLLMQALFNPSSPLPTPSPTSPPPRGAIPINLFASARQLALPNPRSRLTPAKFWDLGMAASADGNTPQGRGFFKNNRLIGICEALEGFALASSGEKAAVVRNVREMADTLPDEFLKFRVLPSLVQSLEHGPDGPTLLPLAITISATLTSAEFSSLLLQPLCRLFASPDRALRLALLELLPQYADRLEKGVVAEKIWPNLITGFGDTVPVIREATVKAVPLIAPKLSERLLNNELLRHLAKTQMDVEPGIRTNTCILLSRLSKHLTLSTCRKVLIPAFGRSLRDPFTPARIAGLMALMATVEYYEKDDLAAKVIPTMSLCLVDKEKTVREQAFKALEMFVDKVRKAAEAMPDTAETPAAPNGVGVNGAALSPTGFGSQGPAAANQPGLAMSAAGAAGALAGWAFTSVGRKLTSSDLASSMAPRAPTPQVPTGGLGGMGPLPDSLASSKVSTPVTAQVAKAFSTEPAFGRESLDSPNPWGASPALSVASSSHPANSNAPGGWGDNLMDVEADADDWSTFETGPPVHEPSFEPLPSTIDVDRLSLGGAKRAAPKPKAVRALQSGGGGAGRGPSMKLGGGGAGTNGLAGRRPSGLSAKGNAASLLAALEDEVDTNGPEPGDSWGMAEPAGEDVWGSPEPAPPPAPTRTSKPISQPALAPATDDWGGFDDAPKPVTAPAKAQAPAPAAKEDKAAQMARMREERRAKMAALKAKKSAA